MDKTGKKILFKMVESFITFLYSKTPGLFTLLINNPCKKRF